VTPARQTADIAPHRRSPEQSALVWLGGLWLAVIVAIVLVLALFDWNLLRGPLERLASDATGRSIHIDGDLKVRLLRAEPEVYIGGLRIGQPAWAGAGDMAAVEALSVRTRWTSLLSGRPALALIDLVHPALELRRDAEGRVNWSFSDHAAAGSAPKVPPVERFVIESGRLHFVDAQRKMVIDGTIGSNEQAAGPQAHAFSLLGRGMLNKSPFDLTVTGGAIINVKPGQPYPFTGTLKMGATRLEAKGALHRPFDLSAYTAELHLVGPDLADLYTLTGLALPNTPTYDLRGDLRHAGSDFDFNRITGRIGASDIAGVLDVGLASGRPQLHANLRSRSLDFKDLAALIGGPPVGKAAATANPAQRAQAAALAAEQRILPDTPLQADRLRGMDALVEYSAAAVKDAYLPLRSAHLHLTLEHGLLTMDPVEFDLPQGRFTAMVALDGRGATPVTTVDARLSNLELSALAPNTKPDPAPIDGLMAARIKLTGRGDSVHRAAAAANGAVTLVIPHGHIRKAFAELLGVNAGKGLGLLLSKNQDQTDIRCGVASFNVARGRLNVNQILMDTDVVRVSGQGYADMGDETFNLVLKGDTKRFRLTHVFLPITVRGHFRSPELGIQPAPALAQAGAAIALGVVLTPLAAMLPFVDPGLAKNADCQALMAEVRTAPASVKGALVTAKNKH